MNISLNAKAMCSNGQCGYLNHVILKSEDKQITHLVISDENNSERQYLVPIDFVTDSTEDQIQLNCTRDQLHALPQFKEEEYIPRSIFKYQIRPYLVTPYAVIPGLHVPMKVEHIPAGELAVKKGASVEATDGTVGVVDEFLTDSNDNRLSHLILREGRWSQKEVTIPMDQVDRIDEDVIYLKISKSEVESFPTVLINRFWTKKSP